MRKVLFRGKRKDNGEWVTGNLFVDEKQEKYEILVGYTNYRIAWEIIPSTAGQFTGLTDKNGNKIFEGDIVQYNDGFHCFIGKVKYENGAFGIACQKTIPIEFESSCRNDNFLSFWELIWNSEDITSECIEVEIIGNIFDNPELLEDKQ